MRDFRTWAKIVANRHQRNTLLSICQRLLFQIIRHFIGIFQPINNLQINEILGWGHNKHTVGKDIERIHLNTSWWGDFICHALPHIIKEHRSLQPISFAHPCHDVRLNGTFKSTYLYHLHFDTGFIKKPLEKWNAAGKPFKFHSPNRIQIDFISYRSNIIIPLGIGITIRHNPFTSFFKCSKSIPYGLTRGQACGCSFALQIYAYDALIIFCRLDGV